MKTVINLTPNVQFIGGISIEPFATKTAQYDEAALQAAIANGIVNEKGTGETYANTRAKIVDDASTSYNVDATDENIYRRMTSDSGISINVRPQSEHVVSNEAQYHFKADGAGQITIVEGSGVTVNTSETLKSRKQGSALTLIHISGDEWDLIGDMEAAP